MESGKAQNKRCEKWFFRFFCGGQESVANSIAQQSRNQKTPLFPPFGRERGRVIDYPPPLIPPFARGDTGGCKKTFQNLSS